MSVNVYAISASKDHKWIVCGTSGKGARVWDGEMHKEAIHVEGETTVDAVDVSPDSTRFATGNRKWEASIWSISTGRRLVGPLKHDNWVSGVRFSPSGQDIATACDQNIQIFDSQTGDKLVTIDTHTPALGATTPIAWLSDGQQIFAGSRDKKFRLFDASTGTQLIESQILHGSVHSIALASNGKFVATLADRSITFLDTSTLVRIGPVIEDDKRIRSVAISLDGTHLATGRGDGKIVIRDLRKILPELYGPVSVSIFALPCFISQLDKICGTYSRAGSTR